MRESGVVRFVNRTKGWAFIGCDSGGPDAFFLFSDIADSPRSLEVGERVSFSIFEGDRGPRAVELVRVSGRRFFREGHDVAGACMER